MDQTQDSVTGDWALCDLADLLFSAFSTKTASVSLGRFIKKGHGVWLHNAASCQSQGKVAEAAGSGQSLLSRAGLGGTVWG